MKGWGDSSAERFLGAEVRGRLKAKDKPPPLPDALYLYDFFTSSAMIRASRRLPGLPGLISELPGGEPGGPSPPPGRAFPSPGRLLPGPSRRLPGPGSAFLAGERPCPWNPMPAADLRLRLAHVEAAAPSACTSLSVWTGNCTVRPPPLALGLRRLEDARLFRLGPHDCQSRKVSTLTRNSYRTIVLNLVDHTMVVLGYHGRVPGRSGSPEPRRWGPPSMLHVQRKLARYSICSSGDAQRMCGRT